MNRSLVFDLATGAFVGRREDGLFIGPPGSGKSHLAQAIGQAVIQQGYRVLYRETHTLLDELAEATLDGTRKERMEFLETVPLLIIDDLGMRKLPLTAAEELLEIIMRLRTGQHTPDLESSHRGLGEDVGRHRCRQCHARPSSSPRACAQVRSAQLENQNRIVFDGTTKSERNEANRWRSLMRNAYFSPSMQECPGTTFQRARV
jgi:energy-coupling factor transporter ATP-binding protein EcfA2